MKLFGRKKLGWSAGALFERMGRRGHQALLESLCEQEKIDPGVRERLAGAAVFDLACNILKDGRGVRVENVLAALAAVAGQECIAPILDQVRDGGALEQFGLTVVTDGDGRFYYFGDSPNRLLVEASDSVIGLAFGAAEALGAPVTADMVEHEMAKVASRVGDPSFEELDLPPENMIDRPTEWARVSRPKLAEVLDRYEVPPMRRAAALGYALQKAIEAGSQTLDPLIAAKIVLQSATRTAKVLVA